MYRKCVFPLQNKPQVKIDHFLLCLSLPFDIGFPGGSDGKESACNARDLDSITGSGRSPGEQKGNPLQYISAWRILRTEEASRLQSLGSQRIGYD